MAISSISSGNSASFGISLTKPNETSATSAQAALPRVDAVARVSTATDSDSTALSNAAPVPRGVPLASTSNESALEASIAAALARAQTLVGASEAQNVVNDDGSVDYAALAKIIAEQQQAQQAQNISLRPSTQPVNLVDILA